MQALRAISYSHGFSAMSCSDERSRRSAEMKTSWVMSSARA